MVGPLPRGERTARWFDVLMGTRIVYQWDANGRMVSEERVTLRTLFARLGRRVSDAESS